jgi:hypothetical protein
MANQISYIVVKSLDIAAAMKASEKSEQLSSQVKGQEGLVWAQTVHIIMNNLPTISSDTTKEGIQKFGEALKGAMASYILANTTIPDTGKNRDGKDFQVCGKDGVPKWASWAATRRIWSYLGDIAKVLAHGLSAELYPEEGKVCPRCDILKQCKGSEEPFEAIERHHKGISEALLKLVDPSEQLKAQGLINSFVVPGVSPLDTAQGIVVHLDALLSMMSSEDKALVRANLSRITKHFA